MIEKTILCVAKYIFHSNSFAKRMVF